MNRHPNETELALLAGGDRGRVSGYFLRRHVRQCRECTAAVARFELQRVELSRLPEPDLDWTRLGAEMKANIRLGLEAGACVDKAETVRVRNPRLGVAFACLAFLVCAGLTMNRPAQPLPREAAVAAPVLQATAAGVELRDGASSFTMLTHGGASGQTVNAEGEFRAQSVENGAVTITSVSF